MGKGQGEVQGISSDEGRGVRSLARRSGNKGGSEEGIEEGEEALQQSGAEKVC